MTFENYVCGFDEVGKGAIAGPVVVASVVFYNYSETSDFLLSYSSEVIDTIKDKFGIILEYEPSILC